MTVNNTNELEIILGEEEKKKDKKKSNGGNPSYIDSLVQAEAWTDFVPIVSNGKNHSVYLSDEILQPDEYNKLCYFLDVVPKGHSVKIHLNTPGGNADSAFMVINSIKNSDAEVIAVINGSVCSAGTIITMACDDIIVGDYSQFMIHNYSTGTVGKGHEIKAYVDFNNKELNEAFADIYSGFLSVDEMDRVIDGFDMWINKTDILKRFEAVKVRNRERKGL